MINSKKKGFTIVELVIVIAVVAILAAVLIPTFSNLVKKANLANDQSMIRNMNTTLTTSAIIENDFKYAGDAIESLNKNGFTGKYNPYSANFHYGYDLKNNKMYLIDDNNEVIYPNNDAQVSDLWILWSNKASDKVVGATKYVSLVNIENGYYLIHFNDGANYTLDLNMHFVNAEEDLPNVTAINGVVIQGAKRGEGIVEMTIATVDDIVAGSTIENKVFNYSEDLRKKVEKTKNVTYKNCQFYHWVSEGAGIIASSLTFDGCVFIDADDYCFNIQGDSTSAYEGTLTVKNCTFTNCAKIFNIPLYVNGEENPGSIIITGNTFNYVTGSARATAQLMAQKTEASKANAERGYMSITISNNIFTGIATSQAGLFTLDETIVEYDDIDITHITFSNNTISNSIPVEKYIVNDNGKPDNDPSWPDYAIGAIKSALIEKLKASK